jgi:hypothetical protein
MIFDRKGQMKTIEAFLAASIIFLGLLFAGAFPKAVNQDDRTVLSALGMHVLLALDANGSLGELIYQKNWSNLNNRLEILMPISVSYNLMVFDQDMNQINTDVISNGGIANTEVESVQYVCVSRNPQFCCYIVRLGLAYAKVN